jgi:Transposase DDE domain group 1
MKIPSPQLKLGQVKGREIVANFTGGKITSNAGIILLSELDEKLKIIDKFANCFQDHRHPSYTDYSVAELLKQRIYGIVLGYEDLNDHDKLRHDLALALAINRANFNESSCGYLAGKSTLNRLEYCPAEITNPSLSRYHRISHQSAEIERTFVEMFISSYKQPPSQIILDMDVTDDQVHGQQEGAFFNTYYDGVCYAPLYIFCGHHLLAAKLRSSNVDPAAGAIEELQRIITIIRAKWTDTQIIVRGDSAYAREEIMAFCEQEAGLEYVLAMASNNQLKLRATQVIEKATLDYLQRLEPVEELMETLFDKKENLEILASLVPESTWFRSIYYQTEKSWTRSRRVVTKVCYGSDGWEHPNFAIGINTQRQEQRKGGK